MSVDSSRGRIIAVDAEIRQWSRRRAVEFDILGSEALTVRYP